MVTQLFPPLVLPVDENIDDHGSGLAHSDADIQFDHGAGLCVRESKSGFVSTPERGRSPLPRSCISETTEDPITTTENEDLYLVIILIPAALVVVIIGFIVCGIFICRRRSKASKNEGLFICDTLGKYGMICIIDTVLRWVVKYDWSLFFPRRAETRRSILGWIQH